MVNIFGKYRPVRIGEIEHIQIQTLSRGQFGDSIAPITSVGKTLDYTEICELLLRIFRPFAAES